MSRHDRDARRLVCCSTCRHDKGHVYRSEDGTITVACAGCGKEMFRAQEAATA